MIQVHGSHRNTLIGVNDILTEDEWMYSSSVASSVAFDIPWNIGQPDGLKKQNCIIFGYSQDERWNDMECLDKFRFICEF